MLPHPASRSRRFQRSRIPALLLPALVAALAVPADVAAQRAMGFEDFAAAYTGPNAQGYFGPFADVITAGLNSGFFGPVPARRNLSIRAGLIAPFSLIGDGQRTFRATTDASFTPTTTVDAPTIVGPSEPVVVREEGGTAYVFPAGLNIERMGLVVPQFTVGGVLGTELTLRWAGITTGDDFGRLELLGGGVRHNLSWLLPALPVAVGVGAMYNTMTLGNHLDVAALLVTVQASRKMGWFDTYGGVGWESATTTMSWNSDTDPSGRTTVDLDGVNGLRGTAGVALMLPVVGLNTDVTFGSQTVVSLVLSFGSR